LVLNCINTATFTVLINGFSSAFLHLERGLCQGCLLSPLLFLLVGEGMSKLIHQDIVEGNLKGISVSSTLFLSHLLFVDDILILCEIRVSYLNHLKTLLSIFCEDTCMQINREKSSLFSWKLSINEQQHLSQSLDFRNPNPEEGFKYFGFNLKPNGYDKKDWH